MKNPFIKQNDNNPVLIGAIIFGAIAAAAATYTYFIKRNSNNAQEEHNEHSTDYLQARIPKKRKKRTDLHELEHLVVS